MPSFPFLALLLLLPLFASRSSSLLLRNCSSYLHHSHSIYVNWEPPSTKRTCELRINLIERTKFVVSYTDGDARYSTTPACLDSIGWQCEPGCGGLFFADHISGAPSLALPRKMPITLISSYLRLRFCHPYSSLPYPRVRFHISTDRNSGDYQDPVWRVLGPVLATVCMVATVFLVCVCYVQHAYQRTPQCCRWINGRLHSSTAEAGSAGNGAAEEAGGPQGPARMHRPVEPLPDQPPAYDDFRKYHRPCSFGQADRPQPQPQLPAAPVPVPPSYTDAVKSLRRKEENEQRARARLRMRQEQQQPRGSVRRSLSCGANRNVAASPSSGVDNHGFLREENAPPAFTEATRRAGVSVEDLNIDVDLGEGVGTMTRDTSASNC